MIQVPGRYSAQVSTPALAFVVVFVLPWVDGQVLNPMLRRARLYLDDRADKRPSDGPKGDAS